MKLLGPFLAGILLTTAGLGAAAMFLVEPVDADQRAYRVVATPGAQPEVTAMVDVTVRDVTPLGVTPGPRVEGPLVRVEPRERRRPEPIVPTLRYDRVVVLDAGHFRTIHDGEALVVRIAGVDVPSFDYICGDLGTEHFATSWRCGAEARTALARLIGVRSVECVTLDNSDPMALASQCSVGGRDIATWLVEQGWAMPQPGSDRALLDAADLAREAGLGLNRPEGGPEASTAATL